MPSVANQQVDISSAVKLGGWMNESELTWLATQALRHQYIVEFGVFHGRSARVLADHLPQHGKVWAVDPWKSDYRYEDGSRVPMNFYVMPYFIHNLKDHIDAGRVIPVREFSYNFSLPFKVDMVFIDGDHRYETVKKDIKKAFELLRPGGLICGHDYGEPLWAGVQQAVDELIGKDDLRLVKETSLWFSLKY